MLDMIELIFEFQLLSGKRDLLGIPLTEEERGRVYGLGLLLDVSADGGGAPATLVRPEIKSPVQFTTPQGFGVGYVRELGGTGMTIVTRKPLGPGQRTVVRIADPTGGREFVFPCKVIWSRPGPDPAMGLAFDGVPMRMSFRVPPPGEWSIGLRMSFGRPPSPLVS